MVCNKENRLDKGVGKALVFFLILRLRDFDTWRGLRPLDKGGQCFGRLPESGESSERPLTSRYSIPRGRCIGSWNRGPVFALFEIRKERQDVHACVSFFQ